MVSEDSNGKATIATVIAKILKSLITRNATFLISS
jgi:hypothetical protein